MKTIAHMLVTMAALATACGPVNEASSSKTASAGGTSPAQQAVAIEGVTLTPVNGGINPGAFAVDIAGQVMLGANACVAAGRSAELKQQEKDSVVRVTAYLTVASDDASRICPMDYNPVYQPVSTTVRGENGRVSDVVVVNAGAMGRELSAFGIAAAKEIVIGKVKVVPVNAGINPSAFALDITATVLQGANPCDAANAEVTLVQDSVQNEVHVKALRRQLDPHKVCTREWRPVYKDLTTTVRGFSLTVNKVILDNVGSLGKDVDADKLTH